jgi:hypothetical protein
MSVSTDLLTGEPFLFPIAAGCTWFDGELGSGAAVSRPSVESTFPG